jgi:hypothetical protein
MYDPIDAHAAICAQSTAKCFSDNGPRSSLWSHQLGKGLARHVGLAQDRRVDRPARNPMAKSPSGAARTSFTTVRTKRNACSEAPTSEFYIG